MNTKHLSNAAPVLTKIGETLSAGKRGDTLQLFDQLLIAFRKDLSAAGLKAVYKLHKPRDFAPKSLCSLRIEIERSSNSDPYVIAIGVGKDLALFISLGQYMKSPAWQASVNKDEAPSSVEAFLTSFDANGFRMNK